MAYNIKVPKKCPICKFDMEDRVSGYNHSKEMCVACCASISRTKRKHRENADYLPNRVRMVSAMLSRLEVVADDLNVKVKFTYRAA